MKQFTYERAASPAEAASKAANNQNAKFIAGGTNLLDLMKLEIESPTHLIDVNGLDLDKIEQSEDGGVRIGALVRNTDLASDERIRRDYGVLSRALLAGASGQLRNKATTAGNLLQRTRCPYFYDTAQPCNKRKPGSGCSAIGGVTRNHAVLGTSESCIASYPGDLAVALVAFDATVVLGAHHVPIEEFFLQPGVTPDKETMLQPGDIITAVTIPASAVARNSTYLKVRDRQSYEFAAASAAVGIELEADGKTVRDIRVALGGVATTPWRARAVEAALLGKVLDIETVEAASQRAMDDAVSQGDNHYKLKLAPRVIARAIQTRPRFLLRVPAKKVSPNRCPCKAQR